MPTPVAHTLAGGAVWLLARGRGDLILLILLVFAACAADLDFALNFLTGENYHHYFTHSIALSGIFSIAMYGVARAAKRERPGRDALLAGFAYLTHLFLDSFSKDTTPPYGMEMLWPFSERFVHAPVTLFSDVQRGTLAKLFSLHNWKSVGLEVLLVGPIFLGVWWWTRPRGARPTSHSE